MISATLRNTLLLSLFVFALCLGAWGQSCSNSTLTGGYGIGALGTDASGNSVALAGLLTADGNGNLKGTQTESVNGTISSNVPISGTYSIGSNCNGTAKITPKGGATQHYNVTVASQGTRFFTLETDTGSVLSLYGRSTEETSCPTNASGTFGFTGSGSFVGAGNIAISGQITLDGAGHVSGVESSSVAGKINSNIAFTGTYTLKSNCTGKVVFKPKGGTAVHISFALVRQMQAVFFVETDANSIIAGWDRE